MSDQGNYSVKSYFGGSDTQEYRDYQSGKKAGKYSDLSDYVSKTSGAKPISYSGGSSSGNGDLSSTIKNAISMAQNAVQPAVSALQATAAPLKQRYDDLIASIKGEQTTAENRQSVTTNSELAKRGISNTSGLAQQELTNALNPITSSYTGMIKDTGNQENVDMSNLAAQVAQLQSGAGLQGLTLGNTQYSNAQTQKQQDLANQLAQMTYQNVTLPSTQADINYKNILASKAGSSSSGMSLDDFIKTYGGNGMQSTGAWEIVK